jgi:hypothetical protein
MRFMVMVKSDDRSEAGVLPDEKMLSEMGTYNEELVKAGVMLAGEGLKASSKGTRIRYAGGKFQVIDGPFAEAKELVGGFWLMQAKSKAEVVEWVKRVPLEEGEIEVRPLYELEDFPVDASEEPDGWREKERSLREAGAPQPTARRPGDVGIRYIGLLKADRKTEAGAPADPKLLEDMGRLMEDMTKAGILISGEGLRPSREGARVRFSGTKRTVVDGPFTEAKELVAGYSIFVVRSKEEAIEWTKRFVKLHCDGTGAPAGECELRELFELEDFPVDPAEKAGGWREKERQFRDGQVR